MRETLCLFARQTKWKKHKLCLLLSILLHLLPHLHVAAERNDEAYSLLQTTMEPLPHGLLVLSSSKPLTGRTGHELRDASATGTTGDTTACTTGILPQPDKDSSYVDDMPCRPTPLKATSPPCRTPSRKTPRRRQTSHRDRLRIDPGLHRSSRLDQDHINHQLLGKTTKWEPISHSVTNQSISFGNQPDYSMTHPTAIHVQSSTFGGPNRCEATGNSIPVSWKY